MTTGLASCSATLKVMGMLKGTSSRKLHRVFFNGSGNGSVHSLWGISDVSPEVTHKYQWIIVFGFDWK